MSTQQGYRTIVTVAGRSLGEFMTRKGGKTTGEPKKARSGGSRKMKSYGVLADHDDITATRVYEVGREPVQVGWLRSQSGRAPASLAEFPIDLDDVVIGDPTIYVGMLMSVDDGEVDVDSDDLRMLELGIQVTDIINPKK